MKLFNNKEKNITSFCIVRKRYISVIIRRAEVVQECIEVGRRPNTFGYDSLR